MNKLLTCKHVCQRTFFCACIPLSPPLLAPPPRQTGPGQVPAPHRLHLRAQQGRARQPAGCAAAAFSNTCPLRLSRCGAVSFLLRATPTFWSARPPCLQPGKHSKKHDDDDDDDGKGGKDEPADCKDIKERKECRKSKTVCSWCEGKFGPAGAMDMCIDEVRVGGGSLARRHRCAPAKVCAMPQARARACLPPGVVEGTGGVGGLRASPYAVCSSRSAPASAHVARKRQHARPPTPLANTPRPRLRTCPPWSSRARRASAPRTATTTTSAR